MKTELTLYTRANCSLCHRLLMMMNQVLDDEDLGAEISIRPVDIERDPGLIEQYRYRIPVVTTMPAPPPAQAAPDARAAATGEAILFEGRPEIEEVRRAILGLTRPKRR